MSDISELKAYIQELNGEVVDDMVDNFEFLVRKSLSIFNRWNANIKTSRIYFSTQIYEFAHPYPRWVTITSADGMPDKLIWSADLLYEYNKDTGTLTINSVGIFLVRAAYNWVLEEINLDNNEDFVDLVLAHYLIASGNRRKSYQMNDLPFNNDGAERVQEGREMLEKTEEALRESAPLWAVIL